MPTLVHQKDTRDGNTHDTVLSGADSIRSKPGNADTSKKHVAPNDTWQDSFEDELNHMAGVDKAWLDYFKDTPPQLTMNRVVVFSAFSTMAGNIGQANYTAANIQLDMLARQGNGP